MHLIKSVAGFGPNFFARSGSNCFCWTENCHQNDYDINKKMGLGFLRFQKYFAWREPCTVHTTIKNPKKLKNCETLIDISP